MTENLQTLEAGMCKNLAFSEHSRDTSSFFAALQNISTKEDEIQER